MLKFDPLSYTDQAQDSDEPHVLLLNSSHSFEVDTSRESAVEESSIDFMESNAYCPKKRILLENESVSIGNILNGE